MSSSLAGGGEPERGTGRESGVRKHKRRVIYLTDYEKSFPIASERRHWKPISLAAAFGVCAIRRASSSIATLSATLGQLRVNGGEGGWGEKGGREERERENPKARKDFRRSAIYSRVDFPGHPLA